MTASLLLAQHLAGSTGLLAAGDPASSRLVYSMVVGLVVVGIGFVVLGVWIIRQTRHDLQALAPLERMGDRDWTRHDPSTQRRMLDQVRPDGAEPLRPEPLAPTLDADFEQATHPVSSFSDLGPGIAPDGADPTPAGASVSDLIAEPEKTAAADEPEVTESPNVDEPNPVDESDPAVELEPADEPDPVNESDPVGVPDKVDESDGTVVDEDAPADAPR